jgi:hypothetical protein
VKEKQKEPQKGQPGRRSGFDLVGKGGHIRTVPVPDWVKRAIDEWVTAAGIKDGKLFRCVCRAGNS